MSQPAPHVIPYTPRPLQWRFHEERSRFCVLLCHRRFGKTVAAVNDLVRQALRVMHAVKRWRNVLIGDAFHGMRLHMRCL